MPDLDNTDSQPNEKFSIPYYKALDGLRAVAVGVVLFAHAGIPVIKSGGVGVDIFLVLSGFLITSILVAERRTYTNINLKYFYARRALRLSPCLLLTCLFVGAGSWILEGRIPWSDIAISMTYTANWARALFTTDLGALAHCWSLSVEEQYYLVWPFVLVALERISRDSVRNALFLISMALVVAWLRASLVGTLSSERIYFGLDMHMDGLILGSALAYMVDRLRHRRLPLWADRILSFILTPCAFVGLAVVIHKLQWWNPWMGRLGFLFVAGGAATIILDLTVSRVSIVKPLLGLGVLVFIGRISYGIYLLHLPVFHFTDMLHFGWAPDVTISFKILTSVFLATLSYLTVERYFLRYKSHFSRIQASNQRRDQQSVVLPQPNTTILVTK